MHKLEMYRQATGDPRCLESEARPWGRWSVLKEEDIVRLEDDYRRAHFAGGRAK
jgi:hypothetical protein